MYTYSPAISVKVQNIRQIKPVFETTQRSTGTGDAK